MTRPGESGQPEQRVSPGGFARREFLRLAAGSAATAVLLAGCGVSVEGMATPEVGLGATGTRPDASIESGPTVTPMPTADAGPQAGLDVKIGQMLMVGFRGLDLGNDHFIVRDMRDHHLGGVVLFDYDVPSREPLRNIESPEQVKALVNELQSFSSTPLLVAVDHEGGEITRLKEKYGFPATVSHQVLGDVNDQAFTYEQATGMAATLAALGINLNLAPVVDVNVDPANPVIAKYGRSFSANPETVTAHAFEFIRAHHEQGVLCALKHFPGHGSSTKDSHLGIVDVTETWSRRELVPYVRIIEAGQADAIMTAHVFNADLDAEYPATLSPPTVTGLLRQELGYDGVVISDDMQMGAISKHYGFEMAVRRAIEAGIDIIAFVNNSVYEEDVTVRATAHIKRLVHQGIISEARIDQSYHRIRQLKDRLIVA